MKTIEINSIEDAKKTIEIIIDGVSTITFASFCARTHKGNQVVIKSNDFSPQAIIIDSLNKLTINGDSVNSAKEAVVKINELNFNSGGGSSVNNPAEWGAITGDLDNQSDLRLELDRIEDIATGARIAIVFDTEQQMEDWLSGSYTRPDGLLPGDLKTGESIYIRAADEPDYWWDGTQTLEMETKTDLTGYYNRAEVDALLDDKVDKITGKGLSANDYTDADKDRLHGITVYATEGINISTSETNVGLSLNLRDAESGITAGDYTYHIPSATQAKAGVMTKNDKIKLDSLIFEKNGIWYLDSVNSNDSNDGKSPATAKKTFKSLLDYLEGVVFNPKTPTDTNKTAIEVYLADGTYELQYFLYDRPSISGMIIYGNISDNKLVNLSIVDVRHIPLLRINDVTVFKSTSNTSNIGILSSTVYFINCRFQHIISGDASIIDIGGTATFSAINGVSKGYGAFGMSNSYIYFHPSGIFIEDSNLTKSIFYFGGGFIEMNLNNVVTDGNSALYTGKFIEANYGGMIRFFNNHIKQILPNCILNMTELNTDSSDISKMNLFSKIIQEHNLSTDRDKPDCHPISAITGLNAELSQYRTSSDQDIIDETKQDKSPNDGILYGLKNGGLDLATPEVPENEFIQSNKTNGSFMTSAIGQDGKLYFGSNDNTGIWYLDDNGQIIQSNKTDTGFMISAIGQDGKLYFGSNNLSGIWYLDNDGQIKQSNKTDGGFTTSAIGQDGRLYFGSGNDTGIWYLDSDGQIKQSNKTDDSFITSAIGQDGRIYFGSNDNAGIWYLDNDGQIKQSNKTDGYFIGIATGQNGKLYFGSNDDTGIWYLDSDGQIKQSNKTDGGFTTSAIGLDGKLYFGSNDNTGIWYLDDDGLIKQTNKTNGRFMTCVIGQDGRIYFGSNDNTGIWYLDNDGLIKQTNKTDRTFWTSAIGLDGKLYFGSNTNGIWCLENKIYARKYGAWEEINLDRLEYVRYIEPASSRVIISGLPKYPKIDIDISGDVVEFFTSTETPSGSIGDSFNGLHGNLTAISAAADLNINDVIYYANNMRGIVSAVPNATDYTVVLTASAQLPQWGQIQGALSNQTDLQNALNDKVDKITGKGLSTNDFTNANKTKLDRIISYVKEIDGTVLTSETNVKLKSYSLTPSSNLNGYQETTFPAATESSAGVMSAEDKRKLESLNGSVPSHNSLSGRTDNDCHNINSITGLLEFTERMGPQNEDVIAKYAEEVYGVDIDMTSNAGLFVLMNIVINDIFGKNTGEFNVNWIDSTRNYDMAEEVRELSAITPVSFGLYNDNVLRINFAQGPSRHLSVKVRAYCKDTGSGVIRPVDPVSMQWLTSSTNPVGYVDIPVTKRRSNSFISPDYAGMESTNRISARGGTWTVDREGYVRVTIQAETNTSAWCEINSVRVGQNYSGTTSSAKAMLCDVYEVKPGDVVRLSTDSGTAAYVSCYYIPPVYVNGQQLNYSTAEQDTGRKWIDGKPIYQKTVNYQDASGLAAQTTRAYTSTTWLGSSAGTITSESLLVGVLSVTDSNRIGGAVTANNVIVDRAQHSLISNGIIIVKNNTASGWSAGNIILITGTVEYTKV